MIKETRERKINKMKKKFVALTIGIGLITLTAIPTLSHAREIDSCYPMTALVTEVNISQDLVTVTNANGLQYQFYGVNDWIEGDVASLIMNDKGTEIVYDDEIVSARYSGIMTMFE